MPRKKKKPEQAQAAAGYDAMIRRVVRLVDQSRRVASRAVNAVMTSTYWAIGRHIVEYEQRGRRRADYGEDLLRKMAADLTARCGRGFSHTNLKLFRQFYLCYPRPPIGQTVSDVLTLSDRRKGQTVSDQFADQILSIRFPLPWSAYVRLIWMQNARARAFYESEALRGGWSVRQLDRQINSMYRTSLPDEGRLAQEIERTRALLRAPRSRGNDRSR